MKKSKFLNALLTVMTVLSMTFGALGVTPAFAAGTWENVGPAGFSAAVAHYTSLVFDNGTPYVAYRDAGNSDKATVMKFDALSGSWVTVGSAGFSAGQADFTSLAFDNGTPYVAYRDRVNSWKVTVMKFDALSGSWVTVGSAGFSAGQADSTSLAIHNGTPYVGYMDYGNSQKATVMKFDALSGSWVTVGSAGFSAGWAVSTSLAFDNGTPYVAYRDGGNSNKATVMKFDALSGNWVTVGSAGFSAGGAQYTSLAFDNGTPYVAYMDDGNSNKATVMKFDALSGSWVTVGSAGFSAGQADFTSLAIHNGTPYVAYRDGSNSNKATVMKFDALSGSWVTVGSAGFSTGWTYYPSLAIHNGTPYVANRDAGNSNKATVMKFASTDTTAPDVTVPSDITAEATSSSGATVNFTVSAQDGVDGALTPSCDANSGDTFPIGTTTVSCSATDAANNTGSASFDIIVQDTTAPVVTVPSDITAEATSSSGAAVTFTVSAQDDVDGALTPTCDANSGDTFPMGTATVTCSATDGANNTGSASFDIIVQDTTAPDTTIDSHPTNPSSSSAAVFTFSGSDLASNIASFECQVDGGGFEACTSGEDFGALSDGSHTFEVRAMDAAGNTDASPASYTWTISTYVASQRAKNGGFNTYTGASVTPKFWTSQNFTGTDGKSLTVHSEGTASVRMNGATTGRAKILTQTLTLSGSAGDKFTFSFKEKGNAIPVDGVCWAKIKLYNGATLVNAKKINCTPDTHAFQAHTLTLTASGDYTQVVIRFVYKNASGSVWFDGVSLMK